MFGPGLPISFLTILKTHPSGIASSFHPQPGPQRCTAGRLNIYLHLVSVCAACTLLFSPLLKPSPLFSSPSCPLCPSSLPLWYLLPGLPTLRAGPKQAAKTAQWPRLRWAPSVRGEAYPWAVFASQQSPTWNLTNLLLSESVLTEKMLLWPEGRLWGLQVYTASSHSSPLPGGRKPSLLLFHCCAPHRHNHTRGRDPNSARLKQLKRPTQVQSTLPAARGEFAETSSLARLLALALGVTQATFT